jgi:hypothetical protein
MYICLHVKYQLFLSDFYKTWVFSTDLRKEDKYRILSKYVRLQPSCSLWTDMTKLIVCFRSSANSPENGSGSAMVKHTSSCILLHGSCFVDERFTTAKHRLVFLNLSSSSRSFLCVFSLLGVRPAQECSCPGRTHCVTLRMLRATSQWSTVAWLMQNATS